MLSRFAFALCIAATVPAAAQQLDLPRPSPTASVSQTVGVTQVTVDYSSPGVKGRVIWGNVVPYGQVWRTGANASTKITFSKDVVIDGKKVPAASYSLFTIPVEKGAWTVILSKKPEQRGAFQYDKADDLMRWQVTPVASPLRERLAFVFANVDDQHGELDLEWEKLRLPIVFSVDTAAQAAASIKGLEDSAWQPWNQAARYELDAKSWDQGLALVDKSIALRETWFNTWTKAQLLAGKGRTKEAVALAEKAQAMGAKEGPGFFAADEIKKDLAAWKKK